MAFVIAARSALDGSGTPIPGGVEFIDISGTGAGPWIIAKSLLDPNGANVQFVNSLGGAFVAGDTADGQGNVTGGNPVKIGAIFNTSLPNYATGQIATLQSTTRGILLTQNSSNNGVGQLFLADNADGVAASATVNAAKTISRSYVWDGSWERMAGGTSGIFVAPSANAPGSTTSRIQSGASTNGTNLKGSAGNLMSFTLSNTAAAARFFKWYDKATAPTVGTDTPKYTILLPSNQTVVMDHTFGERFTLGIGYGITTGVADGDTGATVLNDVIGQVTWI